MQKKVLVNNYYCKIMVLIKCAMFQEEENKRETFNLEYLTPSQGGDSQNILGKFKRFLVTLRCFYRVGIHRK